MNIFKDKLKLNIVKLIVFAMLLQLAVPITTNFSFAEEGPTAVEEVDYGEEAEGVLPPGDGEQLTPPEGEEPGDDELPGEVEPGSEPGTGETGEEELPPGDEEQAEVEGQPNALTNNEFGVTAEDGNNLGNIFTSVKLTIDGEEISEDITINPEHDMEIGLELEWELRNDVVLKSGDTATIRIPKALEGIETGKSYSLYDKDNEVVGNFTIDQENNLVVTFNDVLTRDDRNQDRFGKIGISLKFNLEEFKEDAFQVIDFGEPAEKTFIIKAKPIRNVKPISKSGGINPPLNPTHINWVIDVNTSLSELNDAVVEDIIPDGLELDFDSIEITELTVGSGGNISDIEKQTSFKAVRIAEGFKVKLEKTDRAYRIRYTTKIIKFDKAEYKNEAILTDGDKSESAFHTIEKIIKQKLIEKTVEDKKVKNPENIKWTIDVNKAEMDLTNAKVVDETPNYLQLLDKTLKIYELVPSGDEWESIEVDISEFTLTNGGFPITLGPIGKKAYRIQYETKVLYGDIEEFKKELEFNNTAILEEENVKIDEDSASIKIERESILHKEGYESTNYNDPKISWKVHVNKANHSIKKAVVTDTIGNGIKLEEENDKYPIVIKDSKGTVVDPGSLQYGYPKVMVSDDGKTLTVELGDIDSYYTIEYDTAIVGELGENETTYKNKVTLTGEGLKGDGIGEEGYTIEKEIEVTPDVNNNYTKSAGAIDYINKTISWVITVDAKKEEISSLKITDTFGKWVTKDSKKEFEQENNMVFLNTLENTLKVEKIKNGVKTTLIEDTHFTLKDNKAGGFELTFKNPLEKALYTISFDTSFDPDAVLGAGGTLSTSTDLEYVNQAKFEGTTVGIGGSKNIDVTKNAEKPIKDIVFNGGKKDGELINKDREIKWKIYVNALGQVFDTFTIDDTIGLGHKFKDRSLVIKNFSVNKDGNFVDGSVVENIETTFTSKTAPENGFTLTFANGINGPYLIEYTTTMDDETDKVTDGKYTNSATVTSRENPYEKTVEHKEYETFVKKGTDTQKAYIDDIITWKVNLNDSLRVINGAVFKDTISIGHVYVEGSLKVVDINNNVVDITAKLALTDNEKDKVTTLVLNLGDISSSYTVMYDTVILAKKGDEIENKAELSGTEFDLNQNSFKKFTVSQAAWGTGDGKSRKSLEIIKVDENGTTIANNPAQFELYYDVNGKPEMVSGEFKETINGKVQYSNLPYRKYYLREVKAPNGFEIEHNVKEPSYEKGWQDNWPEELIIEIDSNSPNKVEIKVENTKIKIPVTAEKIWNGGPTPRPLIQLQLYRDGEALDNHIVTLENGRTEHTWVSLDKTDINGNEYKYTVKELTELDNYTKEEDGLTVTNTYVSPKTEVTGKKVWVGGPTPRPTIELQLYRDGKAYLDPVKLENGKTEHTWTNLDVTNEFGEKYNYTVDEVREPQYYSRTIDGLTITNTYKSPVKDIIGRKTWVNGELNRPEFVELQLYRQIKGEVKEKVGKSVRLEKGTYEYNWKAQDITDVNGNEYIYLVEEVGVPENYTKVENGLTVTNTYVIPKTEVTGIKEWVGGPSKKPTIELQLYRDGVAFGEPVKLENGQTEYTWVNLDETGINGKEYLYTVDEVEVPSGYRKEVLEDRLTVRNTIIPDDPYDPEGRIRIIKKDSDTRDLLSGAKFDLIDSKGKVVDTLTTNSRGEATSKRLPIGWYTIEETNAPKGYILEAEVIEQKITDGVTSEVVIFNEKEENPEKPVEPFKPTDPTDPGKPTDPEKPTEPGKPTEPDKPVGPEDEFENVDDKNPEGTGKPEENRPTLPKTGYTIEIGILMLGFLLLVFGLILKVKENN